MNYGLLCGACRRARIRATRFVIASEAKQSIVPRKERMDCFVARAPRNDASIVLDTTSSSRRDAPEALMNLPPKEGVGNAGCPLHPQPRVRLALVKSTRVNEYTGITRHSRTQWF